MSEFVAKKKIGKILIEMGHLTEEKLELGLTNQQENPEELIGQILIKLGFINEENLAMALAEQFNVQYIDLQDITVVDDAKAVLSQKFQTENLVVPLGIENRTLVVAITDPTNYDTIDRISTFTGYEVTYMLCTPTQIKRYLGIEIEERKSGDPAVGEDGSQEGSLQNKDDQEVADEVNLEFQHGDDEGDKSKTDLLKQQADQKPIIMLVNKIVLSAIQERTSDIHIEQQETQVLVRYRNDGVLEEKLKIAKKAGDAIVSRIKILSDMNIAERSIPQDGAFTMKLGKKSIDFRVSVIPCAEGECVVMRLLAKENLKLDLRMLGFDDRDFDKFSRAIRRPYGMILVSGPTGSGKTTTLYASLQTLNDSETKIITAEDPVEYKVTGLNQIPVKINKHDPNRSLTFGLALKAILRHDPDVVLLGEIRDHETADIGVKAALTGHLVFSTVHANNAIDVIGRMADLGIDRYLLASAFIMVIAQRLVRTLCPKCKEEHQPDPEKIRLSDIAEFGYEGPFFRGRGCDFCKGSGMKGRAAIYEILVIDDDIRAMIAEGTSLYEIKKLGLSKGMSTLRSSTLAKMKAGQTTIDELIRVSAG